MWFFFFFFFFFPLGWWTKNFKSLKRCFLICTAVSWRQSLCFCSLSLSQLVLPPFPVLLPLSPPSLCLSLCPSVSLPAPPSLPPSLPQCTYIVAWLCKPQTDHPADNVTRISPFSPLLYQPFGKQDFPQYILQQMTDLTCGHFFLYLYVSSLLLKEEAEGLVCPHVWIFVLFLFCTVKCQ